MADVRKEKDANADDLSRENHRRSLPSTTERKPYHAPRLRHLGSVRELTAGASNGATSDGSGFKNG
jgi:hypothetical protein